MKNPLDSNGHVTRCWICKSVNHWSKFCPDNESWSYKDCEMSQGETFHALTLHMSDDITYVPDLMSESCTSAVIDTGASKTVCGEKWLRQYLKLLNNKDKRQVKYFVSNNIFCFGNERGIKSSKIVEIPVKIGKVKATMKSDVIDLNIPLLLSLDSTKKGGVKNFNLMDGTITILNQKVKLTSSQSGHFLIALQEESTKVENKSIRRNKVTAQHGGNSVNKCKAMSLSTHSSKGISQGNRQHYSKNEYQQHCSKNGYHLDRNDDENKRSHGKKDQWKSRKYN